MRQCIAVLCLMCAALVFSGCSRPWVNPNITDEKKADYQFDKDSTDCDILASEQYPLDKNMQLPIYGRCMEDKGWIRREKEDGIPLKKK